MSIFDRKKEEAKPCCCGGNTAVEKTSSVSEKITSIKVLGAGCKSCHQMYENTKKAVTDAGLSVEVEYITDMKEVMQYGAMSMPALVVNSKIVSSGRVLKPAEIKKIIGK